MRRKTRYVDKPKQKALAYSAALIVLSIYAIPRMPKIHQGLEGTFVVLWILFTALAIASNVYFLVGADKERSRMLETEMSASTSDKHLERRRAY